MRVTVIPIVIGALDIVTKELVQVLEDLEIRRGQEIIQTTALLRLVRILRRVLETKRRCRSNFGEKLSADAGGKTLKGVK